MNAVHCVVLGLAIAVEARACSAQVASNRLQLPQNAPLRMDLALAGDNAADKASSDFHFGTALASASFVAPPVTPRTADSRFFLLSGIQLGMAVFDVEMTQRCIASHHCRETNPVMPTSQAGQLSVNFALVACNSGISYWLKKRGSKLWWLPPSAGVVVHSVGVTTGFEHQ